jgi:hypothetical protein
VSKLLKNNIVINTTLCSNVDPKKLKEYGEVTVVWQSAKCIHSGNCVRNNPSVPTEKG